IHRKVASKQVTRGSISAVTLGTTGPIIETAEESRSCCRKQ
ncbi:ras-related protein Rab-25-like, partial [Tachysurus ichikawai]